MTEWRLLGGNRVEDPVIRLRLFGAMEGWSFAGDNVLPRGRKARAILAYLALGPDEAVPRNRLMELLWSGRWEDQARASLRQSLMEIRRHFGAFDNRLIAIDRDRVRLERRFVWIDGLSVRANLSHPNEPDPLPLTSMAPEQLLEELTGIDPRYNEWIGAVRAKLAEELEAAPAIGRVRVAAAAAERAPPPSDAVPADDVGLADDAETDGAVHPEEDAAEAAVPAQDGGRRRLKIVVAPFMTLNRAAIDGDLVFGLTQELVSALARFRWIFVRQGQQGEAGDASYRLEGFVRRTGDSFRITSRLVDLAGGGAIVWSSDEDVSLTGLEQAPDEIARRIVTHVDPEILAIESEKANVKPAENCDAYECVLRAMPLPYRFQYDDWREAELLLSQAIARDPRYSRAYAFSAMTRLIGIGQGWTPGSDVELRTVAALADRAIELDPQDSTALAVSGHVSAFFFRDFDRAKRLFERAIRSNPNSGYAWAYSALTQAYTGAADEAVVQLERASELLSGGPFVALVDNFMVVAQYFRGDWPTAIALAERQLRVRPTFTALIKVYIAALCQAGSFEKARVEDARLRELEKGFSWERHLEIYPFGREQDRLSLAVALSRAGLLDPADAAAAAVARAPGADVISLPNMRTRRLGD